MKAGMVVALFGAISNTHAAEDPLSLAVSELSPQFAQEQWQRLSQKSDRDSLIAALLIASSQSDQRFASLDATEESIARRFSRDPMILFALALACQTHSESCGDDYHDALVKLDPDNAVNWLLRPAHTQSTAADLHSAARAHFADSRLRSMVKIVQTALSGQPAPRVVADIDARTLAGALSDTAIEALPVPLLGGAVVPCKAPAADLRGDCLTLARMLIADQSESLVARMVGSAMLRRLEKGTPEEVAAIQMRRDYVWLDEQLQTGVDHAQLRADMIQYGEWTAWLRAADRANVARQAPADWVPRNPQTLLLSEERTPAPQS